MKRFTLFLTLLLALTTVNAYGQGIVVEHGLDISGTTTTRPANAHRGAHYYNTTLSCWQVYNGTSWENVVGAETVVAVTAAGSVQGDAAALTAGSMNNVTAADGATGVILPAAAANLVVEVYNASSSNLLVYPNTSDTINGGSANAAVTVGARALGRFVAVSAVDWAAVYTAGGTYATLTGAEELTNKTLTAAVIKTGITASGSAANTFASSTGTFITSTGANTLSGAVTINDATTPSLTTASGKTNTGFVQVNGKTSGALKLIAADAAAQTVTVSLAAQTSGAATLTIPDAQGVAGTVDVSQASLAASLVGDDQAVTPGPRRVIQLASDNATDTNRTFTLSATGAITGAIYVLIGPASNACEIADTGIQKLSATWSPGATDTLTLVFDGTNFCEIARSNN